MDLLELAQVLATTEDHPGGRTRVLYLTDTGDGLEPAGFADAVGDVVTVLDRLDTEGADALAVQTRVGSPDDGDARRVAVVATREGTFAVAVAPTGPVDGDGTDAIATDRAPRADDPPALQTCWRLVVHSLAAMERSDAIPEPADDPHPAAYLMAAWLATILAAAKVEPEVLDRAGGLPEEPGLVAALDLPAELSGWDAVYEAVATTQPAVARRLGRNGVAWEAHELLGDPGAHLAAVAESGRAVLADQLFDELTERGWARPVEHTP